MRYAVLADIHGNLHALEAVLDPLRHLGVDAYLVAGDLVGYGPFPNECVERVAELGATCVAGNHDLIVLGLLTEERCIPLARRSLAWTRQVLRADTRTYLESLPRCIERGGIVMTHGSLDHPWEYTTRPDQAVRQLARLGREHPEAHTLLVGHTHRPWACDQTGQVMRPGHDGKMPLPSGRVLLNPGAVGQSRELRARARFLVLDLEERVASFQAVRYDTAACRDALRAQGLSSRSHHLRPTARGAARRLLGAVRSAAVS
jgi:predicted phosphodiesterase